MYFYVVYEFQILMLFSALVLVLIYWGLFRYTLRLLTMFYFSLLTTVAVRLVSHFMACFYGCKSRIHSMSMPLTLPMVAITPFFVLHRLHWLARHFCSCATQVADGKCQGWLSLCHSTSINLSFSGSHVWRIWNVHKTNWKIKCPLLQYLDPV